MSTSTLINLTPHTVVIVGGPSIPPSGEVARVSSKSVPVKEVAGVQIVQTTFGEVVGLPAAAEGTYYVVSALVRTALPSRTDLLSPGDLVRDATGNVVGCRNLIGN
jgi:hypothetical protein